MMFLNWGSCPPPGQCGLLLKELCKVLPLPHPARAKGRWKSLSWQERKVNMAAIREGRHKKPLGGAQTARKCLGELFVSLRGEGIMGCVRENLITSFFSSVQAYHQVTCGCGAYTLLLQCIHTYSTVSVRSTGVHPQMGSGAQIHSRNFWECHLSICSFYKFSSWFLGS